MASDAKGALLRREDVVFPLLLLGIVAWSLVGDHHAGAAFLRVGGLLWAVVLTGDALKLLGWVGPLGRVTLSGVLAMSFLASAVHFTALGKQWLALTTAAFCLVCLLDLALRHLARLLTASGRPRRPPRHSDPHHQ